MKCRENRYLKIKRDSQGNTEVKLRKDEFKAGWLKIYSSLNKTKLQVYSLLSGCSTLVSHDKGRTYAHGPCAKAFSMTRLGLQPSTREAVRELIHRGLVETQIRRLPRPLRISVSVV